jgi:Tol biopolymer transport system component
MLDPRRCDWALHLTVVVASGCGPGGESSPRPLATAEAARAEPAAARVALRAGLPDGLTGVIVFHSDRENRSKLFTLDLSTRVVTPLTAGADHHDVDPSWSPDGVRVVFATTRFDFRSYDLAVAEASGAGVRRLTSHLAFERHPAWSADNHSVLFSSEQDGTQAVFLVRLDTDQITRVSPPPERALMPAAARDGFRVAYVMGTDHGLQVMLHDLRTGAIRPLTYGPEGAASPAWSPDGSRLAYTRLEREGTRIEILEVSTNAVTSLTVDGLAELREPAWSPDGRFLVASGSAASGPRADWNLVLLEPGSPGIAALLTSGPGNEGAPPWASR